MKGFARTRKREEGQIPTAWRNLKNQSQWGFLFSLSSSSLAMIPCLALTFPLTPMLPIFSAQYDSRCGALGTKSQACSVIKYTATINHFVSGSCAFWTWRPCLYQTLKGREGQIRKQCPLITILALSELVGKVSYSYSVLAPPEIDFC